MHEAQDVRSPSPAQSETRPPTQTRAACPGATPIHNYLTLRLMPTIFSNIRLGTVPKSTLRVAMRTIKTPAAFMEPPLLLKICSPSSMP
ncbi:hypothetical protein FOMG_19761 [Fusarium oxysporum f. sp. melonis 26406]|uniref:Uncharacterized protein n=1 Tax=Fusarium oxysporum f. sp. melonis 26406 TaxID=1089452 RepID=W9YWA8_FUSOX|nr:hypothetical protein FOMG_19761 [Fusarium oxysporum f. sp. melonis 26406]